MFFFLKYLLSQSMNKEIIGKMSHEVTEMLQGMMGVVLLQGKHISLSHWTRKARIFLENILPLAPFILAPFDHLTLWG